MTEIHSSKKLIVCADGEELSYDTLVLATGSEAVLPKHTPGHDATGVFVYRTIEDLQKLIDFSAGQKGTVGAVVGGGLLGLEAAKAMMDLECFETVKVIERNRWVLSRQLDNDAGSMVVDQVRSLGVDVLLSKRVGKIEVTENNTVTRASSSKTGSMCPARPFASLSASGRGRAGASVRDQMCGSRGRHHNRRRS